MAWYRVLGSVALAIALTTTGCGDDSGPSGGGGGGTDAGSGGGADGGGGGGYDAGGGGGTTDAGGGGTTDAGGGGGTTDASMPTMAGGIGSACESDADCDGGAMCITTIGSGMFGYEFPGGYCSKECTAGSGSSECGAGADCFSVGFGGFGFATCAKTCSSDADCRTSEGYTCMAPPVGGGTTKYCLPPTGGGGFPRDGGFGFGDGGFGLGDGGFGFP